MMRAIAILTSVCVSLFVFPHQAFTKTEALEPWYQRCLVGMEVGPTGAQFGYSDRTDKRYCARFDGREIVRRCVAARSEYLVIWARDGDYAYYDSKRLPKALGLGERDALRETIEEAHKHNLPVITYCVVQQGGHFLKEHPEYAMRDVHGNRIGRFCYNSGYLEVMKEIVAEQLAYGIDGFHIDMVDQGFGPPYGCWCQYCQRQFKEQYGSDMPSGVTWDAAWDRMLAFRYATSQRFERALYRHIKELNPAATVDYNYHGNPPFSFEVGQRPVQHAGNADFVTGETGVWGFSALTVGLNAEFYRASTPGLPYQVAMQRGVRMYHDQTTRPLHDIRWELLTLLSHGAFVTVVDKTGFDGWLDPVAYDRLGQAFKEVHDKRDHFGHPLVADVGLYFSSRTRDWVGRVHPETYFQSYQGAHKALVFGHIPWCVILDENVTLETLKQVPIVLLPNAGILSERELDLLQRYVKEGGKLVVTGLTGCYDRMGAIAQTSAWKDLIGAKFIRKLDSLDNWVRFESDTGVDKQGRSLCDGIRSDWPFLVKGPAAVLKAQAAKPYGQLLKPYRTTRQQQGKEGTEWPMSADSLVGPAVLVNRIGKGIVVTLACSPGYAAAGDHHIVEARRLLVNAVVMLHPNPRVRIKAPVNVETIVTDDKANRLLRIHLLGYNPSPQTTPAKNRPYILPGLIEDQPLYCVTLALKDSIKQASAYNPTTELQRLGQRIVATVNDIHDVIIVKY